MPAYPNLDPRSKIIAQAESKIIAAQPGAVLSHLDDGGHIPFGGTIGGTRGPSVFGKRRLTRENMPGNPQALLLNYLPIPTATAYANWEKNYKSNMHEDPAAESERFMSSNIREFGAPAQQSSYLADANQTWGNPRQTACTRPEPAPAFFPPKRPATADGDMKFARTAEVTGWVWPERPQRKAAAHFKRPVRAEPKSFLEEYSIRPPWLKY